MTKANLKLLGEAIKAFREQAQPKKISQFRLAAMMHWEGTAPVIEIEKGRRHPRPETLNALGEALQLSPADIAYLHGLAGYRETTVMPPIQQVRRVLQAIEPDIAQRLYPVYVMDYRFRFWMMNNQGQPQAQLGYFDGLRFDVHAVQRVPDDRFFPVSNDGRGQFNVKHLYISPPQPDDFMQHANQKRAATHSRIENRHRIERLVHPLCFFGREALITVWIKLRAYQVTVHRGAFFKVACQRFLAHIGNDHAGRVKAATLSPITFFKQVFKYRAEHFRVNGDILLKWRIILNGEVIAVEEGQHAFITVGIEQRSGNRIGPCGSRTGSNKPPFR